MSDLARASAALREHASFLLMTHTNPDGDAIGGAHGLALALRKMGKRAVFYSQDTPPSYLSYLPDLDAIVNDLPDVADFDALLVLDCGDFERVGRVLPRVKDHSFIVNMDHHASNPNFGHVNLVDEHASSTSEIVYRVLTAMDFEFDAAVATCLYTGVISDTRSFFNTNATPASFRACAAMVEHGADPAAIARALFVEQPPEKARLFAEALATLELDVGGQVAGMVVTNELMKKLGVSSETLEGFVDFPLTIRGVEASYLIREVFVEGRKRIKGSVRTTERVDSTLVTGEFGGGGHRRAAGFTTDGTLADVRAHLVGILKTHLS
ncbi:MAG: DHH family phosphoesterase [Deltaproteobacteria bacterium]|nr:DHH family phosphoesterase [Deltaproteobacteria bacterium]